MSKNLRNYLTALFGFDAVVQRVEPDQWGAESPCEKWDARAVLNHNIFVTNMISELARGQAAAVPATGEGREVPAMHGEGFVMASHLFRKGLGAGPDDDPIAVWNQRRDAVVDALDRPGAIHARARSLWGHETTDEFLGFGIFDPLIHSWDLAKAVGQPVHLDPAVVNACLALLEEPGDGRDMRHPMVLANAVPTDSTDPVDRLIALSGRTPAAH